MLFCAYKVYRVEFTESGANPSEPAGELLVALLIGVGEILAFFELRNSAHERDFESWSKLQEVWTEKRFTENRKQIFERIDNNKTEWTEDEMLVAKSVCQQMDIFSRLDRFVSRDTILDTWHHPVAKAWKILEPIVQEERLKTHWPDKWSGFEKLGKQACIKLKREELKREIKASA